MGRHEGATAKIKVLKRSRAEELKKLLRLRSMDEHAQINPLKTFPPCRIFYVWSMKFVTEAAIRSANAAYETLQQTDGATRQGDEAAILNHLQNVIGIGAALSRYFWPVRPARRQRGELLRAQFNVTDASPLKSRQLRNEIEHFDEKLDMYFSRTVAGVIIPQYIGPYLENGGVPGHFFRAYYTDRGVLEVLGNEFNIMPLVEEIRRIDGLLRNSS